MEKHELEKLEKRITANMNEKWMSLFSKQARYLGNGVYGIPQTNIYSTDTRELFVMFVAAKEGFDLPQEDKDENAEED